MAVRIIDTLATQNDNSFPIALANDIKGGIHSVVNLEYRNNIAEERLEEGMLCYVQSERQMFQYVDGEWGVFTHGSVICDTYDELMRVVTDKLTLGTIAYVSNDVNGKYMYYLSVIGWKSFDLANGRIYIGDTEPEDKSLIWFDTTDESVETMSFPEESTLRDFQATSNLLLSKTTTLENKVNNLKGGTFYNDDTTDNTSGGNYLTFSIKTGSSRNLRQLAEGEMVYCADTGQLWIGVRKSANVSTLTNVCILGGGNNMPDNPDEPEWDGYVELTSNANVKYRLLAGADGRLRLHEASYYEAEDPALSDATNYQGLIINRVFGGGDLNADIAPVSHGFIELYNNNSQGLTLNLKGLSVHYKTKSDSVWQKLELEGYLPYQHSFLIRCARHTSDYSANCRLKIKEYDMDWSTVAIAAGGFSVYLGVGRDLILVENPYNYNDTGLKIEGYIDMIALGKEGEADSISAYEGSDGYYPNFGNFHTGVQRIDFTDTDKSYADLEAVDYQKCDIEIYRPHCSTDGAWDLYYNKIKLNPRIPNMINMCYGKEVTTRTFTWQSVVTETGYLRYRSLNSVDWIYVESDKTMISHHDSDATVHRVIIRNLDYGIYEYQAGEEGAWSDLSTFEIIEHNVLDTDDHIKFLQVSDQQGNKIALLVE